MLVGDQDGAAVVALQCFGCGLQLADIDGFSNESGDPARAMGMSHIVYRTPFTENGGREGHAEVNLPIWIVLLAR